MTSSQTRKKRKLRILGIFNSYFSLCPQDCPISGGEKRFFEVIKRWVKSGLEVEILTAQMGFKTCLKNGIKAKYRVLPLPFLDKFGVAGAYFFRTIISCLTVPRGREGLIIYTETDIVADVIPAIVAKLLNKNSKLICIIFHLVPHYSHRTGAKVRNIVSYYAQMISHWFIRQFADLVFVDNRALKKDLIEHRSFYGFPRDRIVVSSMGIDKRFIDKIKPDPGVSFDGFFLGRLHLSKGIFDLIEIWNLVVKKHPQATLALCGTATPEMLANLRGKIGAYRLGKNVTFLGFLSTKEKFRQLKASRLFVFPSHEEGWGLAVCEAMACARPVVAYDLPVFREVFTDGMRRVRMGDYEAFAKTIIKLLEDSQLYQQLSRGALKVASRYNWDDVAERELSSILGILGKKQ